MSGIIDGHLCQMTCDSLTYWLMELSWDLASSGNLLYLFGNILKLASTPAAYKERWDSVRACARVCGGVIA